jgi:hypothetical protein
MAEIHARNFASTWLWIKPANLNRECWVAASAVDISGDISTVHKISYTRLPHSTLYGPPQDVEASRMGDTVIVSWEPVNMTEDDDRGYLIEANVCQNGQRIGIAIHLDHPPAEITDEQRCSGSSSGKLYTVEKHGYTDPVDIPWP